VTVPLGVLQNEEIRFEPDLHDDIKEELWGVGLGALNRAVMVFGHRFWPVELSSFEVLEDEETDEKSRLKTGNILFESIDSVSNIPVLVNMSY
jgi:monoamine oxidase